ncbi:lipoprotein 17-related variable surface protein [Mycoplasma elephantis]|uniref:lipoprotein 17-related variable surface protein n=1 Tax=Mycoplasma elephantis TaxID=114882 RepID=UPI00146FACFE|nr:lipoprotein 17-related variable surface protein [Mycoplasma elephantis]
MKRKILLGFLLIAPLTITAIATTYLFLKRAQNVDVNLLEFKPIDKKEQKLPSDIKEDDLFFSNFPNNATYTIHKLEPNNLTGELKVFGTVVSGNKSYKFEKTLTDFKKEESENQKYINKIKNDVSSYLVGIKTKQYSTLLPSEFNYKEFDKFKNDMELNKGLSTFKEIEDKFQIIITGKTKIGESKNNDEKGTKEVVLIIAKNDDPLAKSEITVTINGYNNNAKDLEIVRKVLSLINDDTISGNNQNLKPSLVIYNDVKSIDLDLPNVDIKKLKEEHNVEIYVVDLNETGKFENDDENGTKKIKIHVKKNNAFEDKIITLSGFKTNLQYIKENELQAITNAKKELQSFITLKNKNYLPSSVKYTLYKEFDDDIDANLREIEQKYNVKLVFDPTNYETNDDVNGQKTINLKIVCGSTTDSTHTFKIKGYKTEKQFNKEQVDLAFNNLSTEGITKTIDKLPNDVNWNNYDVKTIVNDVDLLTNNGTSINFLRVINAHKVNLNVSLFEDTNDGKKIINVKISKGTGATLVESEIKKVTIYGFKTKAKHDNEQRANAIKQGILTEYVTKNSDLKSTDVVFNGGMKLLIDSINDPNNTLKINSNESIKLIKEENNDGYKLVQFEIRCGNNNDQVIVNSDYVKIINYLTNNKYDEKMVDKAIELISKNKESITKNHLNEYIDNPYNSDLKLLDEDTTFDLQNIANQTNTNISFTSTSNEDGTKIINVTIKCNNQSKNIELKVIGFQTEQDHKDLAVLEETINLLKEQKTLNNKEKTSEFVSYNSLNEIDKDIELDIQRDFIDTKKITQINIIDVTNGDGFKLFNIQLIKGNVNKNATLKLSGYRTKELDENHKKVDQAIGEIKSEKMINVNDKLPSDIDYKSLINGISEIDKCLANQNLVDGANSISKKYGVTLTIKSETNNNDNGSKTFVIEVTTGTDENKVTKDVQIVLSGFKTTAAFNQDEQNKKDKKIVEEIKNKLEAISANDKITINHKDKLPNLVSYLNITQLDNDINFDIKSLIIEDTNIIIDTNNIVSNNDIGSKTIQLKITKGVGEATVQITITGYLTTEKNNSNIVDETIKMISSMNETKNNKNSLPSNINYSDLANLDLDTNLNLTTLATKQDVVISILSQTHNDNDGTKSIVLNIKKDNIEKQHTITISDFKTSQDVADENDVNEVLGNIKETYKTINNKSKQSSELNYFRNFELLANDIDLSLLDYLKAPKSVNITILGDEINSDGYKEIKLQVTKNNAKSIEKTIKIIDFTTKKQINENLVNNIISQIENEYTTTPNNENKLPEDVIFDSINNLLNNSNLLISKFEDIGAKFEIESQNNNELGQKIITLKISTGEGIDKVSINKQIYLNGFKTKAKHENEQAVKKVLDSIKDGETSQYKNVLPSIVSYDNNYKNIDKDLTNQSWDNIINEQKVSILVKKDTNSNNDTEGTKSITFQVSRGTGLDTVIQNKTILISGFINIGQKDVNDMAESIQLKLLNNGEFYQNMYHVNDPSEIKTSDITYYDERTNSKVSNDYKIEIIKTNPKDNDRILELTYTISKTINGKKYTSYEITKSIGTENPKKVIDRVFESTEFGYAKMEIPLWTPFLAEYGLHFHFDKYPNQAPQPLEFTYIKNTILPDMTLTFNDWSFTREKYRNNAPLEARKFDSFDNKKIKYTEIFKKDGDLPVFGTRSNLVGRSGCDVTLRWNDNKSLNWQLNVNLTYSYRGISVTKSLISGIVILDATSQNQNGKWRETPAYGYYPFLNNETTKQNGEFIKE